MVVNMYMYLQQWLSINGYCGELYQMYLMLSPTIEFSQLCKKWFHWFCWHCQLFQQDCPVISYPLLATEVLWFYLGWLLVYIYGPCLSSLESAVLCAPRGSLASHQKNVSQILIVTHFNPSISQSFGDSVVLVSRSELFTGMVSYQDSISYF